MSEPTPEFKIYKDEDQEPEYTRSDLICDVFWSIVCVGPYVGYSPRDMLGQGILLDLPL